MVVHAFGLDTADYYSEGEAERLKVQAGDLFDELKESAGIQGDLPVTLLLSKGIKNGTPRTVVFLSDADPDGSINPKLMQENLNKLIAEGEKLYPNFATLQKISSAGSAKPKLERAILSKNLGKVVRYGKL